MVFDQVEDATIVNSQAEPGTNIFLRVMGAASHDISLFGNELHAARVAFKSGEGVAADAVKAGNNY